MEQEKRAAGSAFLTTPPYESYELVYLDEKPHPCKNRGPLERGFGLNYFSVGLVVSEKSFSVPTTWPWRVPGIRDSGSSSASPDLVPMVAMVTRLTSRVRPTARSKLALASFKSANARSSTPSAVT